MPILLARFPSITSAPGGMGADRMLRMRILDLSELTTTLTIE